MRTALGPLFTFEDLCMFQVCSKIIHNMLYSFALGYGFKSMYVSYLANTLLVINKKSGRIRIIALLYSIVF